MQNHGYLNSIHCNSHLYIHHTYIHRNMSVIPDIWMVEAKRWQIPGQSGQLMRPYLTNKIQKKNKIKSGKMLVSYTGGLGFNTQCYKQQR